MKAWHSGILMALVVLAFCACKPERPKGVLSDSEMERVLYDYHLAQAMGEQSGDSMAMKKAMYMDAALRNHDITQADFDSSMVWYTRHSDRLFKIYERLKKRFADEAQTLGGALGENRLYANLSNTGDTANVWVGLPFYTLTPSPFSKRMTFSLQTDTSFHVHDKIMWKFSPLFLYKEGARRAVAGLIIRYDNDSVSGNTTYVRASSPVELTVEADNGSKIREVSGFIYLDDTGEKGRKMLFIDQFALIRFHQKVEKTDDKSKPDSLAQPAVNSGTHPVNASSVDTTGKRLSPEEFRENQPVERKINIVRERAYQPPVRRSNMRRRR